MPQKTERQSLMKRNTRNPRARPVLHQFSSHRQFLALAPSPALAAWPLSWLGGVGIWNARMIPVSAPAWLPSGPCLTSIKPMVSDLSILYPQDSLSSHQNLTFCPLLECNLRPPQTFVTLIQTSCNPQETAPLVFFITEWNWILICDFFWQTLTRGENIVLEQYCVSLIHLLFSSKCHPRPYWCHVEAQSGPNVTALSCYIVYIEDITRAHQCGSPSQLPGAQVTNWCRNWIAPQETWLPISIPLMEHNWRLALIEDSFQFCDTEDGWGRVIW